MNGPGLAKSIKRDGMVFISGGINFIYNGNAVFNKNLAECVVKYHDYHNLVRGTLLDIGLSKSFLKKSTAYVASIQHLLHSSTGIASRHKYLHKSTLLVIKRPECRSVVSI